MKKIISQILLILLIITIGITSVFINQVSAASMIDVSISSAKEGENFTVKLVLNNEKIAGVNCNVEVVYSDGTKSTTGTKGETGIAWAKVDGTVYGDDFISFTAKKSGTATVKITGINVSDELSNTLEDGGSLEKTITITPKVTEEKPSTNENQGGTTTQPNTNNTPNTNMNTTTNTTTNTTNTNTSTNTLANKVTNTTVEKPIENPKFKEVNEKVYALKNCNVRSSCSTEISSNKIGSLMKGQSVTRTGVEGTWSRIKFNGKVAYIATSLLTTEEPEEEKENTVVENKVDNTIIDNTVLNNVVENNIVDNEISNEELLNQIEKEIGVLPEVGHNIATHMFILISIISLYIIMRIQYKSEE